VAIEAATGAAGYAAVPAGSFADQPHTIHTAHEFAGWLVARFVAMVQREWPSDMPPEKQRKIIRCETARFSQYDIFVEDWAAAISDETNRACQEQYDMTFTEAVAEVLKRLDNTITEAAAKSLISRKRKGKAFKSTGKGNTSRIDRASFYEWLHDLRDDHASAD